MCKINGKLLTNEMIMQHIMEPGYSFSQVFMKSLHRRSQPIAIMPCSSLAQAMAVTFPVACFQQGNNIHKNAHIKYMLFQRPPSSSNACFVNTHITYRALWYGLLLLLVPENTGFIFQPQSTWSFAKWQHMLIDWCSRNGCASLVTRACILACLDNEKWKVAIWRKFFKSPF